MTTDKHAQESISFSTTSPLALCFPPSWSEYPDWEAAAPPRMKSAWLRRLSWRTHDLLFSSLVDFLELHGKTTSFEAGEWQAQLNQILTHPPCRHFFFFLIFQYLGDENFLENLHLEPGLENLFIQWKAKWEQDIGLTERIQQICTDKQLKEITFFRGISISEAMPYPTFRAICSKHKDA